MQRKEAGLLAFLISGSLVGAGVSIGMNVAEANQPRLMDCKTDNTLTLDKELSLGQEISLKPFNGDKDFIIEVNAKGGLDFHASNSDAVLYPSDFAQVKSADLTIDPNTSLNFTDKGIGFVVGGERMENGNTDVTIFASCPFK